MLLLHGGGQNRHAWSTSARRLHACGYTVVAYDTRGHGDSDWDPAGRYDIERLATDLLAVREHFSAYTAPAVVGASLGGMTVLGTHLLTSGASWAAVVLVDVTPRLEFQGARRVVTFMAAHPDGFSTLSDAAEVIAAYNPIARARPTSTACARCYGSVTTAAGSGGGTRHSFTPTSTFSATNRPRERSNSTQSATC